MDDIKRKFLEGCIQGFNDSMTDDPAWIELTKAERKKAAERALIDFDRIFYGMECVVNAGNDARGAIVERQ